MLVQVNPCSGWLTPNETLRNLTSVVSLNGAAVGSPQSSALCLRREAKLPQRQQVRTFFFFQRQGEVVEISMLILSNAS